MTDERAQMSLMGSARRSCYGKLRHLPPSLGFWARVIWITMPYGFDPEIFERFPDSSSM